MDKERSLRSNPPPQKVTMLPGTPSINSRPVIAIKLLTAVCTLSFLITLSASAVRLFYSYHEARALVNEHVDKAGKSVLGSTAESLWRLDTRILQLEMQSVLAFPDISFAEVRETKDSLDPLIVSAGSHSSGPAVEQVFPLYYNVQGRVRTIGSLYLQASLAELHDQTFQTAVNIIVNQAFNTFLVALFTFFILYRLITRHLMDISRNLSRYDTAQEPILITLKRRSNKYDELQQLVNALNAMNKRLRDGYVAERNAEIARNAERLAAETKLHRSEQRLKTILKSSPIPMCITNIASGDFLYMNHPFQQLVGIEDATANISRAVDFYINDIDRSKYVDALRKHGSLASVELQLKKCDGSKFWAMVTATLGFYDGQRAVFAGINDITERKTLEIALLQSREQSRALSGHMESVREEERKHIAMEIHDELGQLLTALKMDVSLLKINLSRSSNSHEKLDEMQKLIENTIWMVRNVASHLRPASLNFGIVPALDWLSVDFSRRHRLTCNLHVVGPEPDLENVASTALFRIAQESLTNVARHAHATTVEIILSCSEALVELRISDDGSGFDVDQVYARYPFGLLGMEERARLIGATSVIFSTEGTGTTITVTYPYHR